MGPRTAVRGPLSAGEPSGRFLFRTEGAIARGPVPVIEFEEVFYRYKRGHSLSQITRSVGQSRETGRRYVWVAG